MVNLQKIDDYRWKIPRHGGMLVEGRIYADEKMLKDIEQDDSLKQVENVATLPGIVCSSFAMPDIHSGYGFPIGGVAGFDVETGVISPGGVGYDINCGVRFLRTGLELHQVKPRIAQLVNALFANVPSGVGSRRKDFSLNTHDYKGVILEGSKWAVKQGFGEEADLMYTESNGKIEGASADHISHKAYERGKTQLGTLGSGNHFIEVDYVKEIFDPVAAAVMGLFPQQIVIGIHTGSRAFGYQICDDYLNVMLRAAEKYHIPLPDRQLCCAPLQSREGKEYFAAMAAAANFAFANRQLISHWVRETFEQVFRISPADHRIELIYDVAHNIAKIETHFIQGKSQTLCVHRKGATRAFPANHPELPAKYKTIGQPVLVPGDMGRYSYILVGTSSNSEEALLSSCHGAGRVMSRHQAIRQSKGRAIYRELEDLGIIARAAGRHTLNEEMPEAYKDVAKVVQVISETKMGKKVALLAPIGVIKG